MHFAIQEVSQIGASGNRHGFNRLSPLAKYNALVAVARHVDQLVYSDRPVLALLPTLSFYGQVVRQLLVLSKCQLFTRDFRGEHAEGKIGYLVFRVEPRPFRQLARKPRL